ncbi:hypothetical protein HQ346_08325 [Rhodococcus sp. BP-252]|uniref:Uncharacterized protein n=2 Tax=Nocardiaceae TaxID=85025 RepID=A0A177YR17_9NOCA|nr:MULTISPECIES: DUF5997 family protein [Rhodococcus]MBY6411305.1 hypothetical protein [Rhodococcus sp. BP-320]MBY6415964.1 hypothetical protein [Rhodococcus sp. BP-321]MBY6420527.1 hypothetical protein [Rhodococcus sp. BP-324]MBY6426171.1 hypothetical protein [Rhodococcus sp. BP-323]MBY6431288.1 hypothetical protein [Rhodococcus sp. BP-322]
MSPEKNPQYMKPLTAANKLGIYLQAAPDEFQNTPLTRSDLEALRKDPPAWLTELQTNGPFPKDVVARKLGVSIAGLARAEITDALTASQIAELLEDQPDWLVKERRTQAEVRAEAERVKAKEEARRAATNRPAKNR